tara:strand:- start:243 stop:956 length:714 start_codon:yes stop_codon:yes gene_type:complete
MNNEMSYMMDMMGSEVKDYDACDASSTQLRLRKLKELMNSSCYVYHLLEEEMKNVKRIECFDISKMNRLCPDVERHILGFIGNPVEKISGYNEYMYDKRRNDYTTSEFDFNGNLKWSLNMKRIYIIKNVIKLSMNCLPHKKVYTKIILKMITKDINRVMLPSRKHIFSSPHEAHSTFLNYSLEKGEYGFLKQSKRIMVDMDNDYKRLEWLNNKWKANPKKIERLATAEIKRLKQLYT